jgi:hypothetical protein
MMEVILNDQEGDAKAYGIPESCNMLALMAHAREVHNAELYARYNLGLDKAQRERLNRDGLIASRKDGARGFAHELTDKGWAWAARELRSGVPPRAGSPGGALYAILNGLAAVLDRRGMVLAELWADEPPHDDFVPEAPADIAASPSEPLRERIRAVYKRLAQRPREWVYLADLRAQLSGVTKAEIDGTLREMFHAREVSLTLEEDQASLTRAQRSAAIRLGADDMHLLSME